MTNTSARPVVVVGAGRVGLVVARVLLRSRPVFVVVRSDAGRARVEEAGLTALAPTDGRVASAHTALLCVADDDLPELVTGLIRSGAVDGARLVAHTSGRHGLGVLAGLPGPVAAIHPAMTFTGTQVDGLLPQDIAYGVTATGDGLTEATALVGELGGRVELVPDEHRPLYHAALSHAANHLNTLIADAADLLRASGVEDPQAVLGPIAKAALANALASGTDALTGPVVRGDRETVAAHLQALDGQPPATSYRAMAVRTVDRAEVAGRLAAGPAEAIRALLAGDG